MDISQRLIELRESRDWPRKKAATMLGVSEQFYGRVEKGKAKPGLKTLAKVAEVYGLPLEVLIEERMEIEKPRRRMPSREERKLQNYLEGTSERGRATIYSVAEAIYKVDQQWEGVDAKSNILANTLGEEFIDALKMELSILALRLGSTNAAMLELLRRLRGENFSNDSAEE